MVVLDKTLEAPVSPDPSWGVTPRSLMMKDFSFFIKALVLTAVCAFVAFYPPFKEIVIVDGNASSLGFGFGILTAIAAFFALVSAVGRPDREANVICQQKAREWVGSVLRPYLEKKYGVRFSNSDLFDMWNYPTCVHENRTIEVNIHGVEVGWDERYVPDTGYRTYKISSEGIWLEKVVRPEKISFEPMQPLA